MIIFLLLFVILSISCFVSYDNEIRQSSYLFWTLVLIIFLIVAFRDISIGTDTKNYVIYFLNPNLGYLGSQDIDIGYKMWVKLVRLIWTNEHFFIFCNAFLSFFGLVFFITKLSNNRIFSIALSAFYYPLYSLQFSAMRQTIAISFFLIALYFYYRESKYSIKSLLFYLISLTFHASVIWTLPIIVLIKKVPFSKRYLYIILVISMVLGYFSLFDYRNGISLIFTTLGNNDLLVDRYTNYTDFLTDYEWTNKRILMSMLPMSLICTVSIYYSKNINENILLKMFIVGVIFYNSIITFPIANRLTLFLTILFIVVYANIYRPRNWVILVSYFLTILYFIYNYISSLSAMLSINSSNDSKQFIYKFFFE